MPKEKIFLSAVTGQFKACREALRSDLTAVGAKVVVQEDFTQQGGTLLEKLESYIASCDRIIALIGTAYGWEPEAAATPPHKPARAYTQWEYYFALGERLDGTQGAAKPIYAYFAKPRYLEENPVEQSPTAAQRQQAFIAEILKSGKDRNEFDSIDQLARLVLRDGFKLSRPSKYLLQNLPYDTLGSLFKGRDAVIAEIQTKLKAGTKGTAAIVAKQAIHGLGGVGKSRLAVEYAWRCLPDYAACLFVVADSAANLARNLAALCAARILDLPEQTAREQELQVVAAVRWLSAHPSWLLILDNVDSPEAAAAVERLLPALQNGQVLITSRRTDWDDSIRTLTLDTLAEDDAIAFLLDKTAARRTSTDTDEDAARALAQTLGGLALALEQSGAFINQKRISLAEYRHRWEQQETKLRHFPVKHYPKRLAVTWETSFQQLTPGAQALLNLLCWFAPDPIPRDTFQAAFDPAILTPLLADVGAQDPGPGEPPDPAADLEDLLDELEGLSLLKWESGNRGFVTVHGLNTMSLRIVGKKVTWQQPIAELQGSGILYY